MNTSDALPPDSSTKSFFPTQTDWNELSDAEPQLPLTAGKDFGDALVQSQELEIDEELRSTKIFDLIDADEVVLTTKPVVEDVLGFEVLGELGRGGMGIVYKARQKKLNRIVAIKMLLGGSNVLEAIITRFRQEAKAVASLQHPNIVQVYEVGESEGRPYMVMEYCAAGSLETKIRENTLSPQEAAQLVETLARAMQVAHHLQIIHRDLKPANVLLHPVSAKELPKLGNHPSIVTLHQVHYIPKISDFGLAKQLGTHHGHTHTGAIMGTPSYMAPEQAMGVKQAMSPLADVYSLGAILYELLTGRPPFQAETPMDTLFQVLQQDPVPPKRLQPSIPPDLETICLKCLRKRPEQRYASVEELADDLHRWRMGEPIRARPISRWERSMKWAKRHPWRAAAVLLGILAPVGLLIEGFLYSRQVRAERANTLRAIELAQLEHQKDVAEKIGYQMRWLRLLSEQCRQAVQVGEPYRALLLWTDALRQLQVDGDAERDHGLRQQLGELSQTFPRLQHLLAHDSPAFALHFSLDGSSLVIAEQNGTLHILDARTAHERRTFQHGSALVAFEVRGTWAVTAGTDRRIRWWNWMQGTETRSIELAKPIRSLHLTDTAAALWVQYETGDWALVQANLGQIVQDIAANQSMPSAFSPSGRTLMLWQASDSPSTMQRYHWDGQRVRSSQVRVDAVVVSACCLDDQHLAWVEPPGRVHVGISSPMGTWQELARVDHPGQISRLVADGSGRRLLSLSPTLRPRVWQWEGESSANSTSSPPGAGKLQWIGELPCQVPIRDAGFAADGNWIWTRSECGILQLWPWSPGTLPASDGSTPPLALAAIDTTNASTAVSCKIAWTQRRAAGIHRDGAVRLWQLDTRQQRWNWSKWREQDAEGWLAVVYALCGEQVNDDGAIVPVHRHQSRRAFERLLQDR